MLGIRNETVIETATICHVTTENKPSARDKETPIMPKKSIIFRYMSKYYLSIPHINVISKIVDSEPKLNSLRLRDFQLV